MRQIEPTYLRYIYDSLSLNTIHKDNISALPEGLIGVYEEAILNEQNVSSRDRFLKFFAAWSLLKKEVSTSLMVELLDWEEQEVIDFLSLYTKWFNSPSSGKYLLYHERLRVFFLQKISSHQLDQTNQTIISKCQSALEKRNGDEWEVYALEHLPSHLLIAAMQSEADGLVFKKLVYDTSFWNRQIEISKGYEWSKRMLNQSMTWAAKQNTDELVECALNKIDLHHMEQNDAPRIVELVAQNDIETALQRIESFGGNDEEGLQRKFILYMLCLMELTLLDSKDKPFRRDAIEKILKHFDENMPIDHSILKWSDFFPSYLMFLMACEWEDLWLDYLIVYKRTIYFRFDWLHIKGPYSDMQFKVIMECATGFIELEKSDALSAISIELAKQGKIEESHACAREIIFGSEECRALSVISTELAKQGKIEESLECVGGISVEYDKSHALSLISTELFKLGRIVESVSAIEESLECAQGISDESEKSAALRTISTELNKQRKIEESVSLMQESLSCTRGISDESKKISSLAATSTELAKQGKIEESISTMQESLECARTINNVWVKSSMYAAISKELAKQGKIEESLECARGISDESEKSSALTAISNELASQGYIEESAFVIEESLECARGIRLAWEKSRTLIDISTELAYQGKIKESAYAIEETLEFNRGISYDWQKNSALTAISNELVKQGMIDESIDCARRINDFEAKSRALRDISTELAYQGRIIESASALEEAVECVWDRYEFLGENEVVAISKQLAKQGKLKECINWARRFGPWSAKSCSLSAISTEMANQGKINESLSSMDEALECAKGISDKGDKNHALTAISIELAKQGVIAESLIYARSIKDDWHKSIALGAISTEMSSQGKMVESAYAIEESLACARLITNESDKSRALTAISTELAKQGKMVESSSAMEESLECLSGISDDDFWNAHTAISTELALQGNWQLAEKTGIEISRIAYRQNCWKELAKVVKEKVGWQNSLINYHRLQNEEARLFYLKGWADALEPKDANSNCLQKSIPLLAKDSKSIEKLLQAYSLNELFFNQPSKELINRLNRTLNIQWAIDIAKNFNKN